MTTVRAAALVVPFVAIGSTVSCGTRDASGACAAGAVAGDLVITEIMANPPGTDSGNEWFEIYNASSSAIDMEGLILISSRDDGSSESDHVMGSVTIEPGQYLVVGSILNDPAVLPAHVDYGYENDLGDLRNTSGRLVVQCADQVIDEALYLDPADSASRGFDGNRAPDASGNDDLALWCDAETEYAPMALGTPRGPNEGCMGVGTPTSCMEAGTPREIVAPAVGDLVITEFHPNPDVVDDGDGEWFELLVNRDVDLNGLEIGTELGEVRDTIDIADCIRVTAGSYAVIARNPDPGINGGLPQVDAEFDFALGNNGGELFIGRGGELLDVVNYSGSDAGATTQVDPDFADAMSNDDPMNFCPATEPYGDGDLGTPGAANSQCPIAPVDGMCDDGGTMRAVVSPQPGELVITEFMSNPAAVGDPEGEWFEVLVTADVDLNGLELGREVGTVDDTVDDVACIRVTAGSYAVFARNADMATNGGLPQADAAFDFSLVNSSGTLFVGLGGGVLDEITWASSSSGASTQLDAGQLDTTANDDEGNWCEGTAAYGDGDLGTPGAANGMCGGGGTTCLDGGNPRPIVLPTPGDLVITEVLPNPTGTDTQREWFEVVATANVDLNGLRVVRLDAMGMVNQESTITDANCIPVASGGFAVIARNADPAQNGMLPQVDATYGSVTLVNSNGNVNLFEDQTLLDGIVWTSSTSGATRSLDPASFDTTANDDEMNWCDGSMAYGDGDLGTPAATNPMCP